MLYKLWPYIFTYDKNVVTGMEYRTHMPCESVESPYERCCRHPYDIEAAKELYEGAEEILKNKDY